jgi:hypothetical protein
MNLWMSNGEHGVPSAGRHAVSMSSINYLEPVPNRVELFSFSQLIRVGYTSNPYIEINSLGSQVLGEIKNHGGLPNVLLNIIGTGYLFSSLSPKLPNGAFSRSRNYHISQEGNAGGHAVLL